MLLVWDHPLSSTEGFTVWAFLDHARRTSSQGQWHDDLGWKHCWKVFSESCTGCWDSRAGRLSLGQASRRRSYSLNSCVNSLSSLSLLWNRPSEPVLLKLLYELWITSKSCLNADSDSLVLGWGQDSAFLTDFRWCPATLADHTFRSNALSNYKKTQQYSRPIPAPSWTWITEF